MANLNPVNWNRPRGHAFEAIQLSADGRENLIGMFTVTKRRSADDCYNAAEAACEEARKLAHRPAAFVREINEPGEDAPLHLDSDHGWPVRVTPPAIGALIAEALSVWAEQFDAETKLPSPGCIEDEDISISGADLLEWFAGWRERVKAAL